MTTLLVLLSVVLTLIPTYGQSRQRQQQRVEISKPRLVVVIAIDQFRQEYLLRFSRFFGQGGFRRLLDRGAVFTNCRHLHVPTFTAPGHSTILSGTTPSNNGIVGNEWYDRETGEVVTSVSDTSHKLLGAESGQAASPHRLIGTTLGDELRLSNNFRSKVIGISLKDRAAILPAGKHPTLALWFDSSSGSFVTSTYYVEKLPDWVVKFNASRPADKYFGARWEKGFPAEVYSGAAADDRPYESAPPGGTRTFPHIITGGLTEPGLLFYAAFTATPFANDMLVELAQAAIQNEQLGDDSYPDILTISFSSNDDVGHDYGPYSQEVADMTLRTDQTIAKLLSFLDSRLGKDNFLVVLTADHGVSPIPEYAAELKLGGKRIPPEVARQTIEQELKSRFGEENWIEVKARGLVSQGFVYLNRKAITRKNLDPAIVERAAGEAVLKVPGVARFYTRTDLMSDRFPKDMIGTCVANGFHPKRSPDVFLVPEPMSYFSGGKTGTSHLSPYSYDTHVPLILYGTAIKAGHYRASCSPIDIAPTLADLLSIEMPTNSTGRVLQEAVK